MFSNFFIFFTLVPSLPYFYYIIFDIVTSSKYSIFCIDIE